MEKKELRRWIFPVLFMLYAVWTAFGVFPLVNYESDSGNLISGVSFLRAEGRISDNWGYFYDNQPLTYWIVLFVSWISRLDTEAAYCLVSWLASLALAWVAADLARCLCGVPRWVALAAWVLYPESYACGMYPNSGVLSVAVATWGIWLLWRRKDLAAAVLLCVAPLVRLDVVSVYPVVFPLLWLRGMGWKRSLMASALLALAVATAMVTGVTALGGDLFTNFNDYAFWNENIERSYHWKAIVLAYSLGAVAWAVGTGMLAKERRWMLLFTLLLPMVTEHLVFRKMGCAGKHYLAALPYVAAVASVGVARMARGVKRGSPASVAALIAIVLWGSVSVRFDKGPAYSYEKRNPDFGTPHMDLVSMTVKGKEVTMGLGSGMIIGTCDELMLTTGNFLYPWMIREVKKDIERKAASLREVLGRGGDCMIISFLYLDRGRVVTEVLDRGGAVAREWVDQRTIARPGENELWHTAELIAADGSRVMTAYCQYDFQFMIINNGNPVDCNDSDLHRAFRALKPQNRPVYVIATEFAGSIAGNEFEAMERGGVLKREGPGLWRITPRMWER